MASRGLSWIAAALLLVGGQMATARDGGGRPRLNLRATPRMSFPRASVLLVAELTGGDAVEDFYCPGIVWDWGDGTISAEESDCPPFQDGAKLDRLWSARHAYDSPGSYPVTLRLHRADRTVALAKVDVVVYQSVADP